MADVDPFGKHDRTDAQPGEMGKTIPFTLGRVIEGSTWEPECKHRLEGKLIQPDSKNHLFKNCIEFCPKKQAKPQKHSISIILNT